MDHIPESFINFPLIRLSNIWGVEINWRTYEKYEKFEYIDEKLDTKLVRILNPQILNDFKNVYKDAIKFSISLGDFEVFNLSSHFSEKDLSDCINEVKDSTYVKIEIIIDKEKLAKNYFFDFINELVPDRQYALFLFSESFTQFIRNCTLKDLERNLWKENPKERLIIFITDVDIKIEGPRIVILGGKYISRDQSLLSFEPEEKILSGAYETCRSNTKWQDQWLSMLTPWHLYFNQNEMDDRLGISELFKNKFYNLAILYLADQTYIDFGKFKSRFRSVNQQIEIPHIVEGENEFEIDLSKYESIKWLLDWTYDPQWKSFSDRFFIVQVNIVSAIFSFPECDRDARFLNKTPEIKKNTVYHWETFTQKKIETYFGVVKDLEDNLLQINQMFSSDISSIQKSLSDTVVSAVAVVIATFLSYLLSGEINLLLFKIGMTLYGVYILFIPLIYNMYLQWKKYSLSQDQYNAKLNRLKECLPDTKIEEMQKTWKMAEVQFLYKKVFGLSLFVYLFLGISLIYVSWFLPENIYSSLIQSK